MIVHKVNLLQVVSKYDTKDIYCRSQNMNNQKQWYTPIVISAGIGALSTIIQDAS